MSPKYNEPIGDDSDDLDELDDDYDDDLDDGPLGAGGLMASLGGLQSALSQAQQAASEYVEGTAGGGAITVSVNGQFEFARVAIRPDVVDPADVEMLEDLVLAALNDAAGQIRARQAQLQAQMMSGLGLGGDLNRLLGGT